MMKPTLLGTDIEYAGLGLPALPGLGAGMSIGPDGGTVSVPGGSVSVDPSGASVSVNPFAAAFMGGVMIHSFLRLPLAITAGVHGYKRNGRDGASAAAWGAVGFLFPIITNTVALFQGFGKKARNRS